LENFRRWEMYWMCRCCVCKERGILGAAGGGEGGLLPASVLLAWRAWVLLANTREKWSTKAVCLIILEFSPCGLLRNTFYPGFPSAVRATAARCKLAPLCAAQACPQKVEAHQENRTKESKRKSKRKNQGKNQGKDKRNPIVPTPRLRMPRRRVWGETVVVPLRYPAPRPPPSFRLPAPCAP